LLAAAAETVRAHPLSPGVRDALFALALGGEVAPVAAGGAASVVAAVDETPVARVACVAGLGMLLTAAHASDDAKLRCGVLRSVALLLEASVPNAAALLSHPDWQVRTLEP
jgi:hypothetical protein